MRAFVPTIVAVALLGLAVWLPERLVARNRGVGIVVETFTFDYSCVSGTVCPGDTDGPTVAVTLDGRMHELFGPPLRFGSGKDSRWGVSVDAGQLSVGAVAGWIDPPASLMAVSVAGYGESPQIAWAPGGARFSVLEDRFETRVDRLLVVDLERRRSFPVRLRDPDRQFVAVTWLSDDRMLVETLRADRPSLEERDAMTGRIKSSRSLPGPERWEAITWSPPARRLAFTDARGAVQVADLSSSLSVRRLPMSGVAAWSPDGLRLLALPLNGHGPQLVRWPGGKRLPLPVGLHSATWLPEGHQLVGLQAAADTSGDPQTTDRLVLIDDQGAIGRVLRDHWPASPVAIAAIERMSRR